MTYEWGSKPTFSEMHTVETSYKFAKGEYGIIENRTYQNQERIVIQGMPRLPSEQEWSQKFISEMSGKGARVLYLRISKKEDVDTVNYTGPGGPITYSYVYITVTVEECIFIGDPFVVDDIVIITIIIAATVGAIVVSFMILYPGIIYKAAGLTPSEAAGYGIAQLPALIPFLIIIFLVVVVFAGWPKRR